MRIDRLVLVRSAATAATRRAAFSSDEPLDAAGVRAAERLAQVLGRVDAARSSPARCARMTAAAAGWTAAVDPDLAGPDPRAWAGLTLEEVGARDPEGLRAWRVDVAPASVTVLHRRDQGWGLSRVNWTAG